MQQMSKSNTIIKVVSGMVLFVVSIMVFCLYRQSHNGTENELFSMVSLLTEGYAVKEIAYNSIVLSCGYILVRCLVGWMTKIEAFFLSPVVITSVIGSVVMLMAIIGIPINTVTTSVILLTLLVLTLFLSVVLQNTSMRSILDVDLLLVLLLFASLSTIFTSGILPNFMSHDSYYYIMQYGEIIGQTGYLNFDSAGTFMTWTGVSPAIMSTLAVVYGFETIIANHYLLIFGMLCIVAYSMYKACTQKCGLGKIASVLIAVITGIVTYLLPPVMLMSSWVISNTYNMVWFVAIFYLVNRLDIYNAAADQLEKDKQIGVTLFLSSMFVWLAMSRAEGIVLVCVMIVAFTGLKSIQTKQYLMFTTLCAVFQIGFLLKLYIEQKSSQKSVEGTQITGFVAAVMILAVIVTFLYILLMNRGIFVVIRKNINLLLPILLCVGIAFSAIMKPELFINNLKCIAYNITTQFWNYTPALLGILSICLIIYNKMTISFVSLLLIDVVLSNFLITMFRFNPLRLGYGDSYNRILMSIVPLWIVALITGVYKNAKTMMAHDEGERCEADNPDSML